MSEDGTVSQDEPPTSNTFAELALHRASRRRQDETWVRERRRAATTRFVPIWESKVLVRDQGAPRAILLGAEEVEQLLQGAGATILLGDTKEGAYFAVDLTDHERPLTRLAQTGSFRPLRAVAALLGPWEAGLLAYAKAMVHWDKRHRFCGSCGSATVSLHGGHLRACTNERCGQHHFPRTDPAIIVRVDRGDQCLLGRQPTWPEGLYSIIAGFVEPGETVEAAVAREVQEETGIQITDPHYHGSQPWPFPSSLMLGFTARATSTAIRLHDGELEDARWVSREEVVSELQRGTLQLPSEISISHRLIANWFNVEGFGRLKEAVEAA